MLSCGRQSIRSTTTETIRCLRCSATVPVTINRRTHRRAIGPADITTISGRSHATEAKVIPSTVLIRSPPPPAPTTQDQPPESATTLQPPLTRLDQLDALLHYFHESVFLNDRSCARIPDLYEELSSNAGKMLDNELPYEDTPRGDRKVLTTYNPTNRKPVRLSWLEICRLAQSKLSSNTLPDVPEEDGLVLVAHVVAARPLPIISWSLGFIIQDKEGHRYVVSCSHTLESAMHAYKSANASASSTFIVTRSGSLLSVNNIASSLPLHDVVLYDFNQIGAGKLRSVPVALHPPQAGSEQSLFSVREDNWIPTKVIGYKDPRGNDVEPGTYDELNSISIDVLPTPGSSGGPLISSAGAVTALIRGSRMAYGERGSVGFATPAEKIFEMFQLPGLRRRS